MDSQRDRIRSCFRSRHGGLPAGSGWLAAPFCCYWGYFVGAVAAVTGLVAQEPATSGPNVILHLPFERSRFKREFWFALDANLIQSYGMSAGETVLPLGLAGLEVIVGGYIGGGVADHRRRLMLLAISPY